ncbi:hypothetical protein X742_06085 [Mesorhizobium sp. LNHC232B00]|nr:hypothetical protein X742_06085 [Mesorhizobium sp. LNHC232B00]
MVSQGKPAPVLQSLTSLWKSLGKAAAAHADEAGRVAKLVKTY